MLELLRDIKKLSGLLLEYQEEFESFKSNIYFFEPEFIDYYNSIDEGRFGYSNSELTKIVAPELYEEELCNFVNKIDLDSIDEYKNLRHEISIISKKLFEKQVKLGVLMGDVSYTPIKLGEDWVVEKMIYGEFFIVKDPRSGDLFKFESEEKAEEFCEDLTKMVIGG